MARGWLERLEIRTLAKNSWRNQAASGLYKSHFDHAAITSKGHGAVRADRAVSPHHAAVNAPDINFSSGSEHWQLG
jgi:hypothetical protein